MMFFFRLSMSNMLDWSDYGDDDVLRALIQLAVK